MDIHGFVVFFLLACTFIASPIHSIPTHADENDRFPYVIDIDVSEIFLFNLIKN